MAVKDTKCNVAMFWLLLKKRFLSYHLPCSFKIFINVCFSVCKEEFSGNLLKNVLSFFYLEMLMSAFLLRFKANYLKKMHGYPCGPCRDLLFLQGPHLAQKPLFSRHRPQVIFSRYFQGGKDNKEFGCHMYFTLTVHRKCN